MWFRRFSVELFFLPQKMTIWVWSAVQLPAKSSDGLSAYDFFLAAQLPATVSDGLSSSTSPSSLCDYFACCSLPLRYVDFFTELLQRRDLYDIFASARQGPFCPFTFPIFFSRNDISGQCLRGAEGESYPQSPPAGALLLKKKKKNLMNFFPDFAPNSRK